MGMDQPMPSGQHIAEADAKRAHHLRTEIALANDAARRRKLNALPTSAAESQKDKHNRTELARIMARQAERENRRSQEIRAGLGKKVAVPPGSALQGVR
jgi:hypothetical protein